MDDTVFAGAVSWELTRPDAAITPPVRVCGGTCAVRAGFGRHGDVGRRALGAAIKTRDGTTFPSPWASLRSRNGISGALQSRAEVGAPIVAGEALAVIRKSSHISQDPGILVLVAGGPSSVPARSFSRGWSVALDRVHLI